MWRSKDPWIRQQASLNSRKTRQYMMTGLFAFYPGLQRTELQICTLFYIHFSIFYIHILRLCLAVGQFCRLFSLKKRFSFWWISVSNESFLFFVIHYSFVMRTLNFGGAGTNCNFNLFWDIRVYISPKVHELILLLSQ